VQDVGVTWLLYGADFCYRRSKNGTAAYEQSVSRLVLRIRFPSQ